MREPRAVNFKWGVATSNRIPLKSTLDMVRGDNRATSPSPTMAE